MTEQEIIDFLGFESAISIHLGDKKPPDECESVALNQMKVFKIDAAYFNTDENGNSFPAVFLKKVESFNDKNLNEIAEAHKKIWNYKKVLFLYVYSETEIRIYNCYERPIIKTRNELNYGKDLKKIEIKSYHFSDNQQLQELNTIFSRVAIDTGIIWTLDIANAIRKKINLQRRVDKYLVTSLVNTARQLETQGLNISFIHKIILRSLFLLYLEDRGATDEKFYSKIRDGAKSYFDILEDDNAAYCLYRELEEHFNGNVFTVEKGESISCAQLQQIKKCFISGNDGTLQTELFEDWKLFDFSIIQIELLSEIYENFLFETDPELKKKTGTYYTPPTLVEFMLNEKLPISKNEKDYNIKILDPACGSGIFLVESYKRLVKRYENHHNEKLTDFSILKRLLTDNIFGIELHSQAIKVAAFSLYLALVDNLDPKTLWQNKKLPNLINNPDDKSLKEQGGNLFCRDTILQNQEIEKIKFDLVVGNPPFGTTDLLKSVRDYCNTNQFAKEMVLPFLHKATLFAPNGEIALIFNTKVLTNTGGTYQEFRRWLFNDCYVEMVCNFSILRTVPKNFGGQLFGDATGPISIVFYRKDKPEETSDRIVYYAPKTYIKSNVIEGLIIDFSDVKYLPREECQKPDTKIWKVAMWGGINDWELVTKINSNYENIESVFKAKKNTWQYATGLNADSKKLDFIPEKIIDTKKIQRYYTNHSAVYNNTRRYRNIDKDLFLLPFIVIKQAQANRQIAASYIDYKAYCLSSAYVINGNVDPNKKKALVGIINSKFSKYYLFMIASSWGIERERTSFVELLSIPFLLLTEQSISKIARKVDSIIIEKEQTLAVSNDITKDEKSIDDIILHEILNLTQKEILIIEDVLNYNLDLFENNEKSAALYPTLQEQIIQYGKVICDELNDFLDGQELYVNATVFNINRFTPLMMIKLSFAKEPKEVTTSIEFVDDELKKIDKDLWEQKTSNIYFRKKMNYKTENDIYIIRPNQRRFWSQSMAMEDASELTLEILNGN
jgi:type I restriction-modification system DNA methylase subunit